MSALAIGAVVAGVALIPLAFMVYLAASAPLGFEDVDGFHYGEPDEHGLDDNLGI